MTAILAKGTLALVPALVYLGALFVLDSYKLLKLRDVLLAIFAGCIAVAICRILNSRLLPLSGMAVHDYVRYVAPVVEEAAKAVYVVAMVRSGRTGFAVDAAILGFAVGTGFGVLENAFYLVDLPRAGLVTWLLRGCGTALMHGSTAAVFGIVSQSLHERHPRARWYRFLPGFGLAVVMHSVYNHFLVTPALGAASLVIGVPLITLGVFRQSERSLEQWLDLGFDSDAEMLESFHTGAFAETRIGTYLVALRERFAPEVVADMFCLLQLQAELSVHAKGLLLMRRQGYDVPASPEVPEKLAEIAYLQKSIGRTGQLAIRPFLRKGRRDVWEGRLLGRG